MAVVTIARRACFTVRCNDCGQVAELGGRPVHWPSVRADEAALAGPERGWVVSTSTQRCPACEARGACQQAGHVWGHWARVALGVDDGMLLMERICDRCRAEELAPEDCLTPHHRVAREGTHTQARPAVA